MKKFTKQLLVFLLLLALCSTVCSCGSEKNTTNGNTANPSGNTSEPSRELIVGLTKANSSFDPYGSYGDETYGHMQVYDTLVVKDENGKITPAVADSWEISDDGLTYTMKIRSGIKFSNGSEFTAEDAKFNIDTGIASSYTNWAMVGVDHCDVVDNSTITITLSAADVGFLEKLTWIYLVNKTAYEAGGEQYGKTVDTIVGTGPYIVSDWKPGESVKFTANDDYFRGAPAIKAATFKSMSDANAAVIALQTGELDLYINDVPSISIPALNGSDKVTVVSYPSYVLMDIILNCESGIFTNPNLRQAIAHAVDREKMLSIGTEGQGTIVDYPGGPDYVANPGLKLFPAIDLEKATQIVTDSNVKGTTLTIKTMDTDPWPKLATVLQDDLNKIGFIAKVELMDYNAYSQEVWGNANYEIAICRYWSGTKDMGEMMSLVQTDAGMNFSKYSNPKADEYIEKGNSAGSEDERKGFYAQAIELFTPEVPLIPLYYTYGSRAFSSSLDVAEGNVQYDRMFYYSWKNGN